MKKLVFILTLIFIVNFAFSQNWRIRANSYVTTSSDLPLRYIEGISLSGFYSYRFKPDTAILDVTQVYGGVSVLSNSWANHVLVKIGVSFHLKTWGKWSSNADIEIGNGVALFEPKSLYSFEIQSTIYMNYSTSKNNKWGVGLGWQRIVTPGYKNIIPIEKQTYNILLSLRYAF